MNPDNAIEVRDLHKYFKIYEDKGNMLRERIIHWHRNKYEKREVLKGISFDVKKGEAVALIGSNGCGKSTTLKLLTKILKPNSGNIDIDGKVYSMIELGAGFHPDMTGRENIYINASIFGIKAKEVDKRIAEIIEFSELEGYIDNPVRTYSSGMYMRLAFSIAINVNADILLVDEILAVGDSAFQSKCFNKLRDIKRAGTTIVLVSHNLTQVEQLCDRSIWIKDGLIKQIGKPRDVHPEYLDSLMNKGLNKAKRSNKNIDSNKEKTVVKRHGNQMATIQDIHIFNDKGEDTRVLDVEDACTIEVSYKVIETVEDAVFGIQVFRNDGIACYGTNTRIERFREFSLTKDGMFRIEIPRLSLISGEYWLDIAIESGEGIPVDYWKEITRFRVVSNISDINIVRIPHKWYIGEVEVDAKGN